MRPTQRTPKAAPLSSLVIFSLVLGLTTSGRQTQPSAPPLEVVAPVAAEKKIDDAAGRRRQTFEIVWQAVNEHHFDPQFGGVDWESLKGEFAPYVELAASDGELHVLLQQMLNRLGQSHFAIIPPESIASVGEEEEMGEEGEEGEGDSPPDDRPRGAEVAERMSNGVGIDLRIINGAAVITAVEKISSRVSKGAFEGNFAGVQVGGTFEIFEKAPNKSVSLIAVPESGVTRRGYTGKYGFEQLPYYGFRELEVAELTDIRLNSELHWGVKLPSLYHNIKFAGREKDGDAELLILELTPRHGGTTMLSFDAGTGLPTRKDEVTFEDYREVEGVLMPFTYRTAGTSFKFTEIKFNVAVDDDIFAEVKNCLTKE